MNESIEGISYTEPETLCFVCNQHQTESRTLPCQHSFCTLCLKLEFEAGCLLPIVYCPKCHKRCKLDQLGVLGLPRNTNLDHAVQYYKYIAHHQPPKSQTSTENFPPSPYEQSFSDSFSSNGHTATNAHFSDDYYYSQVNPHPYYSNNQPTSYYNQTTSTPPNELQTSHIMYPNLEDYSLTSSLNPSQSSSFSPKSSPPIPSYIQTTNQPPSYSAPAYGYYYPEQIPSDTTTTTNPHVHPHINNTYHYQSYSNGNDITTSGDNHYSYDYANSNEQGNSSNHSSFYHSNFNAASSPLEFEDINDQAAGYPQSSSYSSISSASSLPYSIDEKGNRIYFTYEYTPNVDNTPPAFINSPQHKQNQTASDVNATTMDDPPPYGSPDQLQNASNSSHHSSVQEQTQPSPPQQPQEQQSAGLLSSITSTLASFKSWLFPEDDVTSTASGKKQSTAYFSPFSVDSAKAQQKFEKWLGSLWFAPYGFAKSCKKDALHPSYVPYFIFSASSHTIYKTTVQKNLSTNKVEGIVENDYNNIVLCCSLLEERASFLKEFEDDWKVQSAKHPSNELNVVLEKPKAWEEVWRNYSRTIIFPKEDEHCREILRKQGLQFSEVSVNLGYKDVKSKLIYLPVFEGFYYYEGKRYKVAVNGHSGKVIGERPYGAGGFGALGNTLSGLFSKK